MVGVTLGITRVAPLEDLGESVAGGRVVGALRPRWESIAFGAAMVMPIERAAGYLWSWIHHLLPGAPPGDQFGWGPALVWASIAALIALVGRSTNREDA